MLKQTVEGTNITVEASTYKELMSEVIKVKNNEYVRQVAKFLYEAKCPACGKKLYLKKGGSYGFFFTHSEKDKKTCPGVLKDYENKKSTEGLSPRQLDAALNHSNGECADCKKEGKTQCNLTFRRDGGLFPYSKKELTGEVAKKYDISLDDVFEEYLSTTHVDFWACAKYKETKHSYKTFTKE